MNSTVDYSDLLRSMVIPTDPELREADDAMVDALRGSYFSCRICFQNRMNNVGDTSIQTLSTLAELVDAERRISLEWERRMQKHYAGGINRAWKCLSECAMMSDWDLVTQLKGENEHEGLNYIFGDTRLVDMKRFLENECWQRYETSQYFKVANDWRDLFWDAQQENKLVVLRLWAESLWPDGRIG